MAFTQKLLASKVRFIPQFCFATYVPLLFLSARFAQADIAEPPVAPSQPTNSLAPPPDINQPPIVPPASAPGAPPVAQPVDLGPPNTASSPAAVPSIVVLNPAAARFDAAMASFNAGQYADCVTAFSAFVRDFPIDRRREEAIYRLGESYRALGRTADALAAYTYEVNAYAEGPLRVNAQLRRGALLFDSGKIAEAIGPLREVVAKSDGEIQAAANYLLGRALLASKNETEARPILQGIADAKPRGKFAGQAAEALAELDDTAGRHAEALPLWQEALALSTDPAVKATLAARGGWSALDANQPGPAEKLFQLARQFDPDGGARKVANTGLLRLLFQAKRYAEWVALYQPEQGKLLDSGRAEILYDLGHAQFSLQHWSEAAEGFDQYLREFPSDPNAATAAYERFLAGTQMDRTRTVAEAGAFLKSWPQSPLRARVELVEAQELTAEKKYREALPLWETLANEKGDADWPRHDILLELARSHDELHEWAKAAAAYQAYLDEAGPAPAAQQRHVQARLAVCLQNSDQLSAATQAWQVVQSQAASGSPEEEMALESLGLIYARSGPAQTTQMTSIFSTLLAKFPQSPLRALAAFTVGDALFKNRDYAGAEKYLLEARRWDAATWQQPATQRLALGAYGMKARDQALQYVKEYDALPLPADPLARQSARLPAALYYWLAEEARQAGADEEAENFYTVVTRHPDPGDLLAGAWWQLGQVQGRRKEWAAAVTSYETYRELKPDAKGATVVLLALGRAQLGAGDLEAAKSLGQQALLQEPEGPNSAAARMLLGETALAAHSNVEAARLFATLAVLFDDPKITPQAMARAADAFQAAGDMANANQWRQKLQTKFPGYQTIPYL